MADEAPGPSSVGYPPPALTSLNITPAPFSVSDASQRNDTWELAFPPVQA